MVVDQVAWVGRLEAGHDAPVGVRPLVGDQHQLRRVLQQARHEGARRRGQLVRRRFVREGVLLAPEERELEVHPGAVLVRLRLRHERRVGAVAQRDLFDHEPVGHDRVGHRQRVRVAQVDLVLAGRGLVVAERDADAHLLQGQHRLAAQVGARVERREVEVAAGVERLGAVRPAEVEELDLR